MDVVAGLALCAGLLAVVAVGLAVALVVTVAARRRLEGELRSEIAELRARLATLVEPVETNAPSAEPHHREYLITTLTDEGSPVSAPVSSGQFVSVALGESLVRVVSLAYGVRRALAPEQRHRIRFEMGREVKRSRRQRRRDLKDARRHLRTRRAGGSRPDLAEDAA